MGDGARTGLASVVTGALFLGALFLTPLAAVVPHEGIGAGFVAYVAIEPLEHLLGVG